MESHSSLIQPVAFPSKTRRPPINALTGLRFLAAIYVVIFHFAVVFPSRGRASHPPHKTLLLFLSHGYLSVTLFFILSGFVLTYNYADRWNEISFSEFLRARLARIYPVYILALLLQLPFYLKSATLLRTLAVIFMVQSWTVRPSDLPAAWNYPAWTLSVELFFYLCFPVLLHVLSRIRNKGRALWITCFVSVILGGAQAAIGARLSWFSTHIPLPLLRLPEFCIGMLLVDYKPKRSLSGPWPMAACLAGVFILLALNTHRFVTLIILPFAALIWLLANQQSSLRRVLESKPFILLGGASYAVYLLQEPLRRWLDASNILHFGVLTNLLIYSVVLTAAGILVFLGFEQPLRRWIRG